MARDGTGIYSIPEAPFEAITVADPAKVNNNFDDIAEALTDSLSRTGQGGMQADLEMASHRIVHLADGTAETDAATVGQVDTVAGLLAAEVTARTGAVGAETTARTAADTALGGRIDAEAAARAAADTAEATARAAGDTALNTSLGGRIDAEAATRAAAVSAEATARDTAISAAVGSEASARYNADVAEGTTRAAADTALGVRVDGEASARASADGALGGRIDATNTALAAETAARTSGDAAAFLKDGSRALTGDADAGGHAIRNVSVVEVGLNGASSEARLHVRGADLAPDVGSFQYMAVLEGDTGNRDRLVAFSNRNLAGSTYTSATLRLRRVVDGTGLGTLIWLSNGGTRMSNQYETANIEASISGSADLNCTAASVVANNTGSEDGVSVYRAADATAKGGMVHISTVLPFGSGSVTVMRRRAVSGGAGAVSGDMIQFLCHEVNVGAISASVSYGATYGTVSDHRRKRDVRALDGAVASALALQPIRYKWVDMEASPEVAGFLAHEVQSVVPEAVTGSKDAVKADGTPDYQTVDHSRLVPILWAAVRELAARVEALEAEG